MAGSGTVWRLVPAQRRKRYLCARVFGDSCQTHKKSSGVWGLILRKDASKELCWKADYYTAKMDLISGNYSAHSGDPNYPSANSLLMNIGCARGNIVRLSILSGLSVSSDNFPREASEIVNTLDTRTSMK